MGHVYLKFVKKLMMSSLILCIATPDTSNFSNFHRIKLKFGLGVDNFNRKIGLKWSETKDRNISLIVI